MTASTTTNGGGRMRKGIVFSIDAALALVIVIMLALWIPQQLYSAEEHGNAFEKLEKGAFDRAVKSFYGRAAGGETIPPEAELGSCRVYYTIGPGNNLGSRDNPQKRQFCEVLG